MTLRPLVLPCLLALAGCGEDAPPPETQPPPTVLRSLTCEGGRASLASGQLLLPEAPSPLAGVQGLVELADDTRSSGGTRRVLLSVRAEGLKDLPLPFALCGNLPPSVEMTAPTLTAWVDVNGSGRADVGDWRIMHALPPEQSWQELTLTLQRL